MVIEQVLSAAQAKESISRRSESFDGSAVVPSEEIDEAEEVNEMMRVDALFFLFRSRSG
jgi:hypothetical protein